MTELIASDVAKSVRFYEQLGFDVARQTEGFAALRWGDSFLFLTAGDPASGGELPNIRIIVADAEREYQKATSIGLTADGPPKSQPYGLRDFTLVDPDNYGIRFAQIE